MLKELLVRLYCFCQLGERPSEPDWRGFGLAWLKAAAVLAVAWPVLVAALL